MEGRGGLSEKKGEDEQEAPGFVMFAAGLALSCCCWQDFGIVMKSERGVARDECKDRKREHAGERRERERGRRASGAEGCSTER